MLNVAKLEKQMRDVNSLSSMKFLGVPDKIFVCSKMTGVI